LDADSYDESSNPDAGIANEGGQVYTGDGEGTGNGGDGTDGTGTDRGFDYANLGNREADYTGDTSAEARTNAALGLLEDIEHFYVHLAEINAPTDGIVCCVSPQAFQDIRALNIARDSSDLAANNGRPMFGGVAEMGGLGVPLGSGLWSPHDALSYQGCTIIKSLHANFGNDYRGTGNVRGTVIGDTKYGVDCTNLAAMIWQPAAVARLTLQGMKVDSVEDVRRNTHFTVASTFKGGGTFRTECAGIMLANAAPDLA
jgi:hypothetical protein